MSESVQLPDGYSEHLLHIEDRASVRKLRLIAAALVRYLQEQSEYEEAKRCDDLIEAGADLPRPWDEIEQVLQNRPGVWRFAHILYVDGAHNCAKELRKLVFMWASAISDYWLRLVLEVVGDYRHPITFLPAWRTDTVVALARHMYDSREFGAMPILADALQDAGCENEHVLNHCRDLNQVHVRGCWVLDGILQKS